MELKFRNLHADEIECRVAVCNEKGVSLLLYKDARVDQNLLDATVGPMNWQKSYQLIDGQLFCTLEIWDDEKMMWIRKQDVGVESNQEAEKGRASDAQKRAAFCFGIGRELYTAPFIWVGADCCTIVPGKNGKMQCYDRFSVSEIVTEGGCITGLVIVKKLRNGKDGDIVFSWGKCTGGDIKRASEAPAREKKDINAELTELASRAGVDLAVIKAQAKTNDLNKLGPRNYAKIKTMLLEKINGTACEA